MDKIGKILPQLLKKHVRGNGAPVLEILTPFWPRVAGQAMAKQARPVSFGNGTLTLATGNPSWAIELRGMQEEIRAAVNSALGRPVVKQLRVRLDPKLGENATKPAARPSSVPTEALRWGPAEASIDPEVRDVLSRSFAKYFGRGQGRFN